MFKSSKLMETFVFWKRKGVVVWHPREF